MSTPAKGKDMTLKVKYARTDSGCLQVFIEKDGKHYASLTVFPKDGIWLGIPEGNINPVKVYPDKALHMNWNKEVCSACGWESEPYEGNSVGFGGTLNCPKCTKANRYPTLEGCHGNVHEVAISLEDQKKLGLTSREEQFMYELALYKQPNMKLAEKLEPQTVIKYVEEHGWKNKTSSLGKRPHVEIYQKPATRQTTSGLKVPTIFQVNIPMSRELGDYAPAMLDCAIQISNSLGRGSDPKNLLVELNQIQQKEAKKQ